MKCILDPDIAQEITDIANNAKALDPHDAKVNNQTTDPKLSSKSRAKSTSEVVTEAHSCEVKGIRVSVDCFRTVNHRIKNFRIEFNVDGKEYEISKKNKPIKKYFKGFQDNAVETFDGTYTWEFKSHKTVHE